MKLAVDFRPYREQKGQTLAVVADKRQSKSRREAAARRAELVAMLHGYPPDLERALSAILRKLDNGHGADALWRLFETSRHRGESFYHALDRTAGMTDFVFFYDAMLDDFILRCVSKSDADYKTIRRSHATAHDALHRAFLAYRQYRAFREAVAWSLLLPDGVPLPNSLRRYAASGEDQFSTRDRVELLLLACDQDITAVDAAIRDSARPLPARSWGQAHDPFIAFNALVDSKMAELARRVSPTDKVLVQQRRIGVARKRNPACVAREALIAGLGSRVHQHATVAPHTNAVGACWRFGSEKSFLLSCPIWAVIPGRDPYQLPIQGQRPLFRSRLPMHHTVRRRAFLVLTISAFLSAEAVAQRPVRKPADTGRIMRKVAALLPGAHLTRHPLDDEISERALPEFLESLDPVKVYFTKADVTGFDRSKDELDDMLIKGDMTFAKLVFDRFKTRLAERVEWTREFVDAGQDFTLDEEFVSDPDSIDYPKGKDATKERWRKRIKYDLLRLKADETPDAEAQDQVKRRYKSFLRRMNQFDDEDVLAIFVTAISEGYDPHTSYMSRRTLEDFEIRMRLNYQGIGARLLDEDGYAVVTSIMPGGAAKKQGGLEAKDKILAVAQGDEDFVDIVGMRLNDAVRLIRGKEGTVVRLRIRRKGVKDSIIVSLTRGKTELQDSKAIGKVFDAGSGENKIKVGIIDLPSFYGNMGGGPGGYRSCSNDVRTLLRGFEKSKVDVAVLDLRFNGGGLLNEAVKLTGLFIDKGPVVQVKGFRGGVDVLDDKRPGVSWNGPLVVLTSKFSASASEIFAGAIKDYGRGMIVGDESSHGKGTVQRVLELGAFGRSPEQLGALKLTVQQFFRPDGRSTQLYGVKADVQLPSFTNEIAKGERGLDNAVPFGTVSPKKHDEIGMVDAKLLQEIHRRSSERLAKSDHFARLHRDIVRYNARKDRKTVTLNLKKYKALLASTESDEKKVEEHTQNVDEVKREIKLNDYLKEVLQIASDYRELLHGRRLALRK